ncbi:MAG: ABC transporter permease subunit [Planctomycetaceae bacterium]
MKPGLFPELPLLRRELTELAARRRTWVLRTFAALAMLGYAFWSVTEALWRFSGGRLYTGTLDLEMLGIGIQLLPPMGGLLFFTVKLLMPSLICGSITIEKERNTLGTLFVTRLSPLTIVLEKLGSRLLPMLTFIVLTFPIFAWIYTLGGIDSVLLLGTLWLLLWECVLFASIGLVCSAWFSTTVAAFIASYMLVGAVIILSSAMPSFFPVPSLIWNQLIFARIMYRNSNVPGLPRGFAATSFLSGDGSWMGLLWAALPSAFASVVLILLARRFLITRAEVGRSSILLKIFHWLDRFFKDVNEWTTGGRMVLKESTSLPLNDPVAWRERCKKSLGKPHYLVRLLLLIQFPVLFICVLTVGSGNANSMEVLGSLLRLLWVLAAMIISVKAATLISSERTRETLDALLSTPMTNTSILLQKVSGIRRMLLMLATPIMTVHLAAVLMLGNVSMVAVQNSVVQIIGLVVYFVGSLCATWILMHLIVWLALRLGARAKTQARSVILVQVVLGLWYLTATFALPIMLSFIGLSAGLSFNSEYSSDREPSILVQALTTACRPDGVIVTSEMLLQGITRYNNGWSPYGSGSYGYSGNRMRFDASGGLAMLLLVTLTQLGVYLLLRQMTCRRSAVLLGRADEPDE